MLKIDLDKLQKEIDRAGHGQKTAIVTQYAEALSVSKDTIYYALRKEFGKQKEVARAKQIEDNLIDMVADIKVRGMSLHLDERELSTENCIKILCERGVEGADKLTVSTVNRRLVENGFRIDDPKRRVEAEYANQEHQIDFSRSKYFQCWRWDPVREDFLLKVSGKELHYKDDDRRLRTWIAQVKDSYSRCRLIKGYAATSEDGFIGLDLLNWNYNRPEDAHAMHHLADRIKTDRGAFSKRKEVQAALKALEIQYQASGRAGKSNKSSQGKVESGFHSLWIEFELYHAVKLGGGATIYLHEYNELLHEWLITVDSQKKHPVYNDTREAEYRKSILAHAPRIIDTDIMEIACKVEERKVPQTLLIQYEKEAYAAPVHCMNKWVRVYKNMYGELMAELISEHHKPFVLKPYHFNSIDDFSHGHALTYRQQRELEIEKQLTGQKTSATELRPERSRRVFMPPRETKIQPDSPFIIPVETEAFQNQWLARVYIGEQLRYMGANYVQFEHVFDPLLAQDLTKTGIDTVLDAIQKQLQMRAAL